MRNKDLKMNINQYNMQRLSSVQIVYNCFVERKSGEKETIDQIMRSIWDLSVPEE